MAQIYLRGRDPITVGTEQALKAKKLWTENPKSQNVLETDGETFKICDIKSISGAFEEGKDQLGKRYDLDNPDDRAGVRAFEKEFLEWYKNGGDKYDSIMSLPRFMEMKGAVKVKSGAIHFGDVVIIDFILYGKISRLWSSLQDLRRRRSKAEEFRKGSESDEDLEDMAQKELGGV